MVNKEHYARLREGVQGWNEWRQKNPGEIPDLSDVDLSDVDLTGADLSAAKLSHTKLNGANLSAANLSAADLSVADLIESNLSVTDLSAAKLNVAKLTGANLMGANLIGTSLIGTDFRSANLMGANLCDATLIGTNFRAANLIWANLMGANLMGVDLMGANLSDANLSGANLSETKFSNANLSRLDLSGLDLSGANLSGANLSGTNLSRTNLSGANLSRTQAFGTDFTSAKFTGACLEDWSINAATKLNDIDCLYIYRKSDKQERCPHSGEFAPGEFTKRFQKALETLDLIFRNGVDWEAFAYSFRKIQIENESSELTIRSIEVIDDIVLVKVNILKQADKTQFHSDFFQGYKFAKKEFEPQYQARLDEKDKEINRLFLLFNQANDKLAEVPKLMAEQSKVQQNFHASVYGVAGNVEGDFNNYPPEQKQNLVEAAADIQKILNQLAQTNPTTDVVTEAIHQEIKRNPTLKARLISALEAGVLEGLKTFVNHPLFNIPAETIKGFLEAE
ncbi:pentapeptide repeat-containing protein [Nostoc sp. WHI]|uniref:pentapeptide repeat-containing protein n=1 Tax=Nostoc sp. WHI TaxID=2650611 RepID=UPI0018C6BEAA|nr:pentapeptide repeat-containing protein [Nostoc sp. WHI]MBG1265514.1 pentapeptide repeat-containing protein [Nostoc sp. WHI]